jgi:hypothetical protein
VIWLPLAFALWGHGANGGLGQWFSSRRGEALGHRSGNFPSIDRPNASPLGSLPQRRGLCAQLPSAATSPNPPPATPRRVTSGALSGLPALRELLLANPKQPDAELADILGEWCSNYESLSQKVLDMLGEKKLKGADNLAPTPSPPTDHQATVNQYPEITQILQTRPPKMGTEGHEPLAN